jgi:uncharacterized protein (TIGR02453 family)
MDKILGKGAAFFYVFCSFVVKIADKVLKNMIKPYTLQFLTDLKENNHKPWFDEHRSDYMAAKTNIEELARRVIELFGSVDGTIGHLQPKDCMFRINRDVRFSANKSPYKTNMGFWLSRGGKKSPLAGYYMHIEPGQSFFGGGIYMPMPPELKKVRQEIAYCADEFLEIVENPAFKTFFGGVVVEGHTLVKVPAGYEADHPAASYLKLKSVFGSYSLTDADLINTKKLEQLLLEGAKLSAPLVQFLNRALID